MPRRSKNESETGFRMEKKRVETKIPEGNVKPSKNHAFLLKLNELYCLIPIRSIAVDTAIPIRPQIEKWSAENGWQIVEHDEDSEHWACISTLAKPGEQPRNRIRDLRPLYTVRYLSYLVARNKHVGEVTADDDLFMFTTWISKQWQVWAKKTKNLDLRNGDLDVPRWTDDDHAAFNQWLDDRYLDNDNFEVLTKK